MVKVTSSLQRVGVGRDRGAHTLVSVLQHVLHLLHRHLQHLCVLHLGMKLWKQPAEPRQNRTLPPLTVCVCVCVCVGGGGGAGRPHRTHVCVRQQSPQLLQTLVDARSPLLLHQRLPGLQEHTHHTPLTYTSSCVEHRNHTGLSSVFKMRYRLSPARQVRHCQVRPEGACPLPSAPGVTFLSAF